MNRLAIAIIAALSIVALALPVAAQDARPTTILVLHDNDIDGPVATAASAAHELHTGDRVYVERYATGGIRNRVDCVVSVGRNADVMAAEFGGTTVVGADRYATAGQVAAALDAC